nr:vegetative cell wall protein gp1-like [Penaeus vannamei]
MAYSLTNGFFLVDIVLGQEELRQVSVDFRQDYLLRSPPKPPPKPRIPQEAPHIEGSLPPPIPKKNTDTHTSASSSPKPLLSATKPSPSLSNPHQPLFFSGDSSRPTKPPLKSLIMRRQVLVGPSPNPTSLPRSPRPPLTPTPLKPTKPPPPLPHRTPQDLQGPPPQAPKPLKPPSPSSPPSPRTEPPPRE